MEQSDGVRSNGKNGRNREWLLLVPLRAVFAALMAWIVPGCQSPLEQGITAPRQRPNIVFILTDDQRFDAMGCGGNGLIQTPNIDRLAAEGVRFRNHFVTTSICCVSRASILTAQYARRHGISDFKTPFRAEQWAGTYPALLRGGGYRTGFIGKFGVGDAAYVRSRAAEFDFWRGRAGQAGEWFIEPNDPSRKHATARFGDEALEFLDGCTASEPFCLSISFNAPHARDGKAREFQPDVRDESLYARDTFPLPETATEESFRMLPAFVQNSESRRRWEKRFATPEMFQETTRDYYRLITGIDREIGRIRAKLAERRFAKNTVIIFTSDNGFFLGEHGLADKWLMYEESIRVPLIVCDPRLPRLLSGTTVDAMTLNIDLAPTMLHLAGVGIPRTMQGRSVVPLLAGKVPSDWRKEFFYEHHYDPKIIAPSEGIRSEHYAYIRWLAPNRESEELYDIRSDPREQHNLAADPSYDSVLRALRQEWRFERESLK